MSHPPQEPESQGVGLVEFDYQNSPRESKRRSTRKLTPEQRKMVEIVAGSYDKIKQQLQKRIIGMEEIIEHLLLCIFSGNHALLIGVPGLAKTLLIGSLSELLDLEFSRIQFTPDLMPSDITGTEILVQDEDSGNRFFTFLKGPIFADIILADEINRTPPKTQAALLEAMEERTVSSTGRRFELSAPFFVLATQNPIEQEGTYPLPAAQLDRFMFNLLVDYPTRQEERRIMRLTVPCDPAPLEKVLSRDEILRVLEIVRQIEIPPEMMQYAIEIGRCSRPHEKKAPAEVREYVAWGASPRAPQSLIVGAKTRAMLHGRYHVLAEDIRAIAHPVMRHRVILNYRAEAEGISPDEIVDCLLRAIPSPDGIKGYLDRRRYTKKLYLTTYR